MCSLSRPDMSSSPLHLISKPSSTTFAILPSRYSPTIVGMPLGDNHPALLLIPIGVATLIYFAASKMFGHDRREPPLAPQSIPFVGHMLGLSRSKFNYYVDLRYCSFHLRIQSC